MRVFYTLFCIATLLVLVGCVSNVEKRRLSTLERMHYSASGEFERRHMTISNAVSQATAQSLKTPRIVEAVLIPGNSVKTNGAIFLYWLCDAPSASGVCVQIQGADDVVVPIDQVYQEENGKNAKDMVLFDAAVHQSEMVLVWHRLVSTGGKIALLANGKTISNTFTLRNVTK